MRYWLYQVLYGLLVALCAAGILWTWVAGGRGTPEALTSGRTLRSVDPAQIEHLIQQQRLSDHEAMFYRPAIP